MDHKIERGVNVPEHRYMGFWTLQPARLPLGRKLRVGIHGCETSAEQTRRAPRRVRTRYRTESGRYWIQILLIPETMKAYTADEYGCVVSTSLPGRTMACGWGAGPPNPLQPNPPLFVAVREAPSLILSASPVQTGIYVEPISAEFALGGCFRTTPKFDSLTRLSCITDLRIMPAGTISPLLLRDSRPKRSRMSQSPYNLSDVGPTLECTRLTV